MRTKSILQLIEQRERMRGTRHWTMAQRIFRYYLASIAKYHKLDWPIYGTNRETGERVFIGGDNWHTIVLDLAGGDRYFVGSFTPEMIAERDKQRTRKEYASVF